MFARSWETARIYYKAARADCVLRGNDAAESNVSRDFGDLPENEELGNAGFLSLQPAGRETFSVAS
jgi:hypothetical protein